MTGKGTLQSEMRIMLKLMELGFIVASCDDSFQAYDLISDWSGVLYRLQVKENARKQRGQGFMLRASHRLGQVGYTKADCDFIVAPVYDASGEPIYIIPVEALRERTSLLLWPEGWVHHGSGRPPSQEFEQFKDAFELLKG